MTISDRHISADTRSILALKIHVSTLTISICFLFMFYNPVQGQGGNLYSFFGTVTDAGTGEPLRSVNVYISGTTDGAATDSSGRYSFTTSLTGSHFLIASYVGYKIRRFRVIIGAVASHTYDIKLEENVFELKEVRITSSNREWKRQYEVFEKFLLGTDSFAKETVIENPEVLDFKPGDHSSEIVAVAREALKIKNEALGYLIEVELEKVRFNTSNNTGFYTIYTDFSPMAPTDEEKIRYWEENRREAYEGSSRHFFESLFRDRLRTNRFDYYPNWGLEEIESDEASGILLSLGAGSFEEQFKVFYIKSQQVMVGYKSGFRLTGRENNFNNISYLTPNEGRDHFLVNSRGQLFDPVSIIFSGRWGNDRLSRLLPVDYSVEQ